MHVATLNEQGQIAIPTEIRARYKLTAGSQVELIDEGDSIRLRVRPRVAPSDPTAGYGMVKIKPRRAGSSPRRLSDFDAAAIVAKTRGVK
jgi:AbrB family looped-hinge helix DNA binding protein